jgi:hypothetical protein
LLAEAKDQTNGKHNLPSRLTLGVIKPREVKIIFVDGEMKWWEQRAYLFTPGSLGATVGLIDFYALQHGYASFIMDCTITFYHADEPEEGLRQATARLDRVRPPERRHVDTEEAAARPSHGWPALGGPRRTDELGVMRCVECPCFFQSLIGVVIELHMDDFNGAGLWMRAARSSRKLSCTSSSRSPRCWSPR